MKLYDDTKKEVERLQSLNVIRRSNSNYGSPAFPILKKNGNVRLVIDYRLLKEVTIKTGYTFPNSREQFLRLNEKKFFVR